MLIILFIVSRATIYGLRVNIQLVKITCGFQSSQRRRPCGVFLLELLDYLVLNVISISNTFLVNMDIDLMRNDAIYFIFNEIPIWISGSSKYAIREAHFPVRYFNLALLSNIIRFDDLVVSFFELSEIFLDLKLPLKDIKALSLTDLGGRLSHLGNDSGYEIF